MDRDRISAITHGDRAFHNPLDAARVAEAFAALGLQPGDRVLDVGCGAGELLVGLAERHGCTGLGVDTSGALIAEARRRAALRAPGSHVEFVAGRAEDVVPDGSFAAACCLGSLHALGATEDELPAFEGLLGTCTAAGLEPVWVATSSPEDWERYEWALVSNGDRWAREHDGDPLADDVRAWIDAARSRLLAPGGTATIGFALVALRSASRTP